MTSPLRIGIVGLGRLGQRHAQALAFSTRNCVLTAACSPVETERTYASTELGIQQVYARFEDLLASPDVDAVMAKAPTLDQKIAAVHAAFGPGEIAARRPGDPRAALRLAELLPEKQLDEVVKFIVGLSKPR